jgi:hypothetical protein
MPWSALPEHLNSPEKWGGTDDDKWWMRWRLQIKGWFAYGPRATEKWAKWREWPVCVLFIRGEGAARIENDETDWYSKSRVVFMLDSSLSHWYISRIQKWCNWHIHLQWPLFFTCHFYIRTKLIYFYIGASRDADKVYWFPAAFIGTTWK